MKTILIQLQPPQDHYSVPISFYFCHAMCSDVVTQCVVILSPKK